MPRLRSGETPKPAGLAISVRRRSWASVPCCSQVWSLYAVESGIAQAVAGWVPTGPKAEAPYLFCSKHLNLGSTIANCWSFACDSQTYTDTGVPVATCHCPIGKLPDGIAIAPRTAFVTEAGQGMEQFCAKHLVSGPLKSPLP